MLKFVKTVFRGFFELILWLTLIGCAVSGGIISYNMTHRAGYWLTESRDGNPVPGILIGLAVGMFLNIVVGGCVATILNIDKNVEELLSQNSISKVDPNEWKCSKCGKPNASNAEFCIGCGVAKTAV